MPKCHFAIDRARINAVRASFSVLYAAKEGRKKKELFADFANVGTFRRKNHRDSIGLLA